METYLKAGISFAVVLFALVWVGCASQVTHAPTSTPGPLLAEGEAIAVVQTLLFQGGCTQYWVGQSEWNGKYGDGGNRIVTSKGIISGEWTVFEKTGSVRILKAPLIGC